MSLPPSSPFYAVPTAGRMACPLCAYLLVWGGKGHVEHARQWNPLSSVLICPKCQSRFQIGIIAWPLTKQAHVRHDRQPTGQRATLAQLAEFRRRAGGYFMKRPRRKQTSTNVFVPEGCCCAPLPWRQECPVHGQSGHDDPSAPTSEEVNREHNETDTDPSEDE